MPEAPLPNDPSSRSSDGTILDQSQNQPMRTEPPAPNPTGQATTTAPTSTSSNTSDPNAPAPAAPATYSEFKAPDGVTFSPAVIESASSVFKELGLNQSQAQKLVDFYAAQQSAGDKAVTDRYAKAVEDQKTEWYNEVMKDPKIGPNIDSLKIGIGRMFDSIGDPKLVNDFKADLERTGMTNNPSLVRMMIKLSSYFTEGTHVSGTNPSPFGTARPNGSAPRTGASAMYPNLPTSS